MGVSLGMMAILATSYIAHLVHIMQRVKQNRLEREEKVAFDRHLSAPRNPMAWEGAFYSYIIIPVFPGKGNEKAATKTTDSVCML